MIAQTKQSSEKEMQFYFEIITYDPLMYTMDLPKFINSIQKEKFISAYRVLMSMAVQFILLSGPVVVRYCS